MTLRINCWSGPRNVSTALMRSFSQRSDTRVVDEPLYGHYLATTDAPHPKRAELVRVLETDAGKIVEEIILGPCERDVLFMKQMVHHLVPDLDLTFLDACTNVLLIRDPAEVIASLVHQLPHPTMRDIGFRREVELFEDLRARGQEPAVLDARTLLSDPERTLRALCETLGLAWDAAMLSWPAGRRPEDGPWGEYWYDSLWLSTGFEPYRERSREVPEALRSLLDEARSCYEHLARFALTTSRAEAS